MPQMRAAFFRANQRAVVHDHGQGRIQLTGHRHSEVIAPTGDQGHLDAAARRFGDSLAVGLRKLPAAIQQGAVNIQRYQSYRHSVILPWMRGLSATLNQVQGYPTPGCSCVKSAQSFENKRVEFLVSAKECARV